MEAPDLSAGTWEIEKGGGNKKLETLECRLRPSEKNAIRPPAAVKTESQIGTIDLLETECKHRFPISLSFFLGVRAMRKSVSYWRFPIQICECNRDGRSAAAAL